MVKLHNYTMRLWKSGIVDYDSLAADGLPGAALSGKGYNQTCTRFVYHLIGQIEVHVMKL